MTSSQLRVTLPGPEGSADAERALKVLERVVELLKKVEEVSLRTNGRERTVWGITDLHLGSVVMTTAPVNTAATQDDINALFARLVDGFTAAEHEAGVPEQWNSDIAAMGAELAKLLSEDPREGLVLEVLDGERVVNRTTVTRRAEEHLRFAVQVRERSIGSVIGRLESANSGRLDAGLKPEFGNTRVVVRFDQAHIDTVRQAWGKRVEVSGVVERDASDRIIRVRMRDIEVLPETAPPLTNLAGLDPNFTGGKDPDDYLRDMRGAA